MKRVKRIASILLAAVMILGMSITAFADEGKSITIKSSPTVDVTKDGRVFTAYKILDAEVVSAAGEDNEAGVIYKVPDIMKDFYTGRYGLTGDEADFAYQVAKKISEETDLYAFGRAALAYANGTDVDPSVPARVEGKSGEVKDGAYVISGLDVGYYVIEDSETGDAASQVMLDTTINNLEITVKADVPTIDKTINGDTDTDPETDAAVDENNASIGDQVPYTVITKVPAMAGYEFYRFVITDTLSKGLTLDVPANADGSENVNGCVTVKIGTLEKDDDGNYKKDADGNYVFTGTPKTLTAVDSHAINPDSTDAAYYVTKTDNADGTTTLKVVFVDFIKLSQGNPNYVGQDIVLEYSATLNEDAEVGTVPNTNTVKLDYSNNPSEEGEGKPDNPNPYEFEVDEPHGVTEEITVRTFVTALELIKTNGQGQTLAGAQFTLEGTRVNKVFVAGVTFEEDENGSYWLLKDGTYTKKNPQDYQNQLDELEALAEDARPENYDDVVEQLQDFIARYANDGKMYAKKNVEPSVGDDKLDWDGWEQAAPKHEHTDACYTDGELTCNIPTAEKITQTVEVDANGELIFTGLSAGIYKITEIKAPDGYNMLTEPIVVKISCVYNDNDHSCVWSGEYGYEDENGVYKKTGDITSENGMLIDLEVVNNAGTLLPSTGGIGTTIFYVVGGLLVLAAVVLLVVKKRMSAEK